ncbi:c-type cytochrome [Sporocytophaga myxococcoides]|nr:cytochrome c [Sporocytophaga myxococcoides]
MITLISAFAIMVSLFAFYSIKEKKQSEQFVCGVVDERPICGNAIRQMKISLIINKTGQRLFQDSCRACHSIHDVVVGPALKDVVKRRPKKWLYKFINNSSAVIKSGDPYAVELFNKFGKAEMKNFNFTKAEIDSILDYIKVESDY